MFGAEEPLEGVGGGLHLDHAARVAELAQGGAAVEARGGGLPVLGAEGAQAQLVGLTVMLEGGGEVALAVVDLADRVEAAGDAGVLVAEAGAQAVEVLLERARVASWVSTRSSS